MLFYSCQHRILDDARITNIGVELISSNFHQNKPYTIEDVVFIGNGLKERVQFINESATKFKYSVGKGGLEKPYGDDKADAVLTINSDYEDLKIRLKYDEELDKYHILGWMTWNER